MLAGHADRLHEQYMDAPDLVIEILSPDNRQDDRYTEAGVYDEHTVARSRLLSGFEVAVGEVWAAAKKQAQ